MRRAETIKTERLPDEKYGFRRCFIIEYCMHTINGMYKCYGILNITIKPYARWKQDHIIFTTTRSDCNNTTWAYILCVVQTNFCNNGNTNEASFVKYSTLVNTPHLMLLFMQIWGNVDEGRNKRTISKNHQRFSVL